MTYHPATRRLLSINYELGGDSMSHFERTLVRAMTAAAEQMPESQLVALLADPTVSTVGRRVLENEAAARSGPPPRGLVQRVLAAVSHEADVVVGARA